MKQLKYLIVAFMAFNYAINSVGKSGGYNESSYNCSLCIFKPDKDRPPYPRMPLKYPIVYYNDTSLFFEEGHPPYILYIIKDKCIIYQIDIEDNCRALDFPLKMKGSYKLYINIEGISYIADINI